jgi:hypothetical protein
MSGAADRRCRAQPTTPADRGLVRHARPAPSNAKERMAFLQTENALFSVRFYRAYRDLEEQKRSRMSEWGPPVWGLKNGDPCWSLSIPLVPEAMTNRISYELAARNVSAALIFDVESANQLRFRKSRFHKWSFGDEIRIC